MGTYGTMINKALLPIKQKAVISHIIEHFPKGSEFVIGLGYLEGQVRQYLSMAHPETTFHFVAVSPFEGQGSGPGYSLLSCQGHLQKEFYFVSCDTWWMNTLDFNIDQNWFGVCAVNPAGSKNYCNLQVKNGRIISIKDKEEVSCAEYKAFVGLCFIKDYGLFFRGLNERSLIAGEHQVSDGIRALVRSGRALAVDIDWLDVGNEEQYKSAVVGPENFDFSKSDEFLYILNGKVIKFFHNPDITDQRVQRAKLKPNAFPVIDAQAGQFYAYHFLNGRTLYQQNDPRIFKDLLRWLKDEFWSPVLIDRQEVQRVCQKFYFDKTIERLNIYSQKYGLTDRSSKVNGLDIPPTKQLLDRLPWDRLCAGESVFIHGDLQFDNILYDPSLNKFILLDWRQDFAGQMQWGDLYYDLAKMMGGIILNYDLIKMNLLWYKENNDGITIDFTQRFLSYTYIQMLSDFITANGWDIQKVRYLVGLIYLNMSPLHHAPFDKILYSLGRYMLWCELNVKK